MSKDILAEVYNERQRQDDKWGEQNHPDWPEGYAPILRGDMAKVLCETAFAKGHGSWAHVLLEEVAEATDEARWGDVEKLREELVQVAAVAVSWIEAIDRRS